MLCACNQLLPFKQKKVPVTGIHSDFSKDDVSSHQNALFSCDGVHGMLEVRVYQCIKILHFSNFCTKLLDVLRTLG